MDYASKEINCDFNSSVILSFMQPCRALGKRVFTDFDGNIEGLLHCLDIWDDGML